MMSVKLANGACIGTLDAAVAEAAALRPAQGRAGSRDGSQTRNADKAGELDGLHFLLVPCRTSPELKQRARRR